MDDVSVITGPWFIAPIASILALGFAVYFYRKMTEASEGNADMIHIAGYVRDGAMAYLRRQYMVVIDRSLSSCWSFLFVLAKQGIQNPFVPVAFLDRRILFGTLRLTSACGPRLPPLREPRRAAARDSTADCRWRSAPVP